MAGLDVLEIEGGAEYVCEHGEDQDSDDEAEAGNVHDGSKGHRVGFGGAFIVAGGEEEEVFFEASGFFADGDIVDEVVGQAT